MGMLGLLSLQENIVVVCNIFTKLLVGGVLTLLLTRVAVQPNKNVRRITIMLVFYAYIINTIKYKKHYGELKQMNFLTTLLVLTIPSAFSAPADNNIKNNKYFKNLEPIEKKTDLFLKNKIFYDKVPLVINKKS